MRTSFTARRRDALGYSGPGSALCRPSATGFLVIVAGLWIMVIFFFGTAVFVHDKSESASPFSFLHLGGSRHFSKAEKPLSEAQLLQREVEELEARLNGLEMERKAMPRPPLELKHVAEAEAEEAAAAAAAATTAAAAAKKNKKKEEEKGATKTEQEQPQEEAAMTGKDAKKATTTLDSDTSPLPLVDPTVLTRSKPAFEHDDMEGLCAHKNDGDEDILKRIDVWTGAEMGKPRILCFSYTLSAVHNTAVKNVRMTWGQRCDGYVAMSDLVDAEVPSIDIKHQGPESYDNMWQKIRSVWVYLHKHHLHEYDYFVSGGDDLFLIIENLRRYLLSDEILAATENGKKPIFLGRAFRPPGDPITFNSGGAGFVLNAAALEVLAKELHGQGKSGEKCRPNQVGFWEDVNVAYCLNEGGVQVYNSTQDPLGRERFLPFTPGNHLFYRVPKNPDWYAKYTFNLKEGKECCSQEAVSFHYVKGNLMKRYHAIVHGMCPNIKPGLAAVTDDRR